jgi:hypothetical protein
MEVFHNFLFFYITMANKSGEKELKTKWPVEEGLTAETTKQTGKQMNLVATKGTLIPRRKRIQ